MKRGVGLVDRISAVAGERIALRSGAESVDFGQLNRMSRRLAAKLRASGMERGRPVAVCGERSCGQWVAALAVMRAGSPYVPIDPAWPEERVRYILGDCGAEMMFAAPELAARYSPVVRVLDPSGAAEPEEDFADVEPLPGSLAYVIYTSGSTGVPKGVEITHENLAHLIAWHVDAFGVTAEDRASQLAGPGFDAAVWEVWPYLAMGAPVSIADQTTRLDAGLLQRWMVEQGITIGFVPTPLAEPMVQMNWPAETRLRCLLTGGDTLHRAPKAGLPFALFNNYGPTECTVVATSGEVKAGGNGLPSIGRAIAGATIYLLDQQGRRVPAGETGEIYVAGGGVGVGYRNRPEQTAQSFGLDPFVEADGARMYKTGDLGQMLPGGEIAFLGRVDRQVKIRGNRIELDEIVSVLGRHAEVRFCTVVVSEDGEKRLVAYVLPADGTAPTARGLQEFLGEWLPSYMVPSVFVRLAELPLSANGKVDRGLLPVPSSEHLLAKAPVERAESDAETMLLEIVRDLLGNETVTVDDDFFLVGGHSLLGTQLVMRARDAFGVTLTLRDLFSTGTVALLAGRVEELIVDELNEMTDEEAMRLTAGG